MPTAVVVDLGSQVSPPEAAWVMDACNAAVVRGSCELDGSAGGEPPRAIAIVRLIGEHGRSVRIEVGLREQARSLWSIREIEFSPRDPPRERWRSVGLVLATLVGEIDTPRAEPESDATGATAPSAPSASAATTGPDSSNAVPAAEAPAATSPAAPEVRPRPAPSEPSALPSEPPASPADEGISPGWPRPGFFIGAGILGAPGPEVESLRWGAGLRAEWLASERWSLGLALDYSELSLPSRQLDVGWFRAALGGGVRLWPSERWTLGLGARLGVRALRFVPGADGSIRSSAWSPLGVADAGVWWRASRLGGVWASVEVGSIGRTTRLFGRDSSPDVVLPAADVQGLFGLWLAP